jgi:hypothetical protein
MLIEARRRLVTLLERRRRLTIAAMVALIIGTVALWAFVVHNPRINYTPAAVFCRPLYAAARNAIDTSRVDATTTPTQRTEGDINPLRCGDLRRANLLDGVQG